ncbi:MAG: hypothetical protein QXU09_04275 [Thermoproteota archaeon]
MRDKNTVAVAIVLIVLLFLITPISICATSSYEHVYYGYVPPTTNIPQVAELIKGESVNYTVPEGVAILDVVGLDDGTYIEIWDIYTNVKIASDIVNKFEKKFFYIPAGSFFKLVSSKRVAALLCGGFDVFESDSEVVGGTSTFYPAVTGGFRGREFIFVAAPPFYGYAYHIDKIGHNFNLLALEKVDFTLSDSIEGWSTSGRLEQRGSFSILLQARRKITDYQNGAGRDVVFHLTTTGDVVVCCSALDDFIAVPALTGGYVGKTFYVAANQPVKGQEGRSISFIILPLEECKVTVYNLDLEILAEKTFTSSDVANINYWFHSLGTTGRFKIIVQSTGDICFMVGQTTGIADIKYLGDDITFIGARPDQEIRFYAPTMAILFAPEDLTATIDGSTVQMRKDEFRLIESGPHTVKANKHIIVQILASGSSGWISWGSYLIEPLDLDITFEELPYSFFEKKQDLTTYYIIAAIATTIAAVILVLRLKIRRVRI